MPNWCENSITIYNPKVFKEKCIKDGGFSFNNIIPMPKHLEVGSKMLDTLFAQARMAESGVTKENLSGELNNLFFKEGVIDLLYARDWFDAEEKRTGVKANGWYEWNCNNWDTKWDVDAGVVNLMLLEKAISTNDEFTFIFDTAWTPPIKVFERMAELGIKFLFESQEPGCQIYCSGESDGNNLMYSYDEDHCWDDDEEEENEEE